MTALFRGRHGAGAVAIVIVALTLAFFTFLFAGAANSKSPTLGVDKTAHVGSVAEPIAVTSKGVAVYELLPETKTHLLCTKANGCFAFWPPVKIGRHAKLTKGAGLKGRLGTLKRSGFAQLTLNGHPLYTFSEDHGQRGMANGNGIHGFGGTWHVLKEGAVTSGGSGTTPTTTTTATSTTIMTTTTTNTTSTIPVYPGY